MFLSNVVFPPPASGTVTFLLHFCSNKPNCLQFIRRKKRAMVSPVLLNRMGGGLYHRLGAHPTLTRVHAGIRGRLCCAPGPPFWWWRWRMSMETPAGRSCTCRCCCLSQGLALCPSRFPPLCSKPLSLLPPPFPHHLFLSTCFLHAGILRNA